MLKIKIARHVFGLENKFDYAWKMCRDYLCNDEPEVVFSISDEEMLAFDKNAKPETSEFYVLHGKIAKWLLHRDVLLFHGSSLALDGNGILFTAPSGTGKSTHARLWRERFGDRVTMINDDKPLLQYDRLTGQWTVYGSPWCGKEGIHTNTSAPLRSIVVIRRGAENSIRRLSDKEAASQFLHQSYIASGDFSLRLKALDLVGRLAQLPVYELGCTISQEAVNLSCEILTEGL